MIDYWILKWVTCSDETPVIQHLSNEKITSNVVKISIASPDTELEEGILLMRNMLIEIFEYLLQTIMIEQIVLQIAKEDFKT